VTLDDRPRSGKEPKITVEAKEWLASLPGGEGPGISPRVVDDPQERCDPKGRWCNFTSKSKILKETAVASKKKPGDAVSIISCEEKPGNPSVAATALDLPPEPGVQATFARDHEYKRLGTVSPLAGIDLVTGQVADGVDDFIAYLRDERGLSASSLHARRWHVGWHVECFLGTSEQASKARTPSRASKTSIGQERSSLIKIELQYLPAVFPSRAVRHAQSSV
jgi:hypothetical protein